MFQVCSGKLVDAVTDYKEQSKKAIFELDNVNEQLVKSAATQVCLRRCLDELTTLAEKERMKRDRDELELQTTIDQLTAELVEVQQEIVRLQSVEAEMSAKLMHRESAQEELDELVRKDNAWLQEQLGRSALVEATLQSKVYDLELELTKRTGVVQIQQEQCQDSFGSETIDSSSTSTVLDQCNLSQTSDDQKYLDSFCQKSSFMDLARGDDQLIPSFFSSKKYSDIEDVQLSCSESTCNDDRQPSSLELTDDDHRPSSPARTAVQDSTKTVSKQSSEELRKIRLTKLIKQYESKHDDDS